MIATHLLSKDEVSKQLGDLGCTEVPSPLPDHSAWRSPWGKSFLVPHQDAEGRTPDWKLYDIIEEINKSKPNCH